MNTWKLSTLALAAALTLVIGKDTFSTAEARPAEADKSLVANQPEMEKALGDLHTARGSLQAAEENKGGWRAAALQHVEAAIGATERGMQFAKNHK